MRAAASRALNEACTKGSLNAGDAIKTPTDGHHQSTSNSKAAEPGLATRIAWVGVLDFLEIGFAQLQQLLIGFAS